MGDINVTHKEQAEAKSNQSKIKYKINGYWREITVEGKIEAIAYK